MVTDVYRALDHASRTGFQVRHRARMLLDAQQVREIWQSQSAGRLSRDLWSLSAPPGAAAGDGHQHLAGASGSRATHAIDSHNLADTGVGQ